MKISIIAQYDDANVGHLIKLALERLGHEVRAYTLNLHPFAYPQQADLIAAVEVPGLVKGSEVVVITGPALYLATLVLPALGSRRLIVYHTGNAYRARLQQNIETFKDYAYKVLTRGAIFNRGSYNEAYISNPVNDSILHRAKPYAGNFTFYHSPSNREKKNTGTIERVLREAGLHYNIPDKPVQYSAQINNIRKSHAVIDQLSSSYNGYALGYWGISSLEAIALGRIAISINLYHEDYMDHYGCECRILTANSGERLKTLADHLSTASPALYAEIQESQHRWLKDYHGLDAFGKKFAELCLK